MSKLDYMLGHYGEADKTRTEILRYEFSDDELTSLAREQAQKLKDKSTIEDEKKRIAKQYGSRIDMLDGEIEALTDQITSGYMMKNIKCSEFFNKPVPGTKEIRRNDTGALVRVDPMDQSEMQLDLEMDDEDEADDEEPFEEVALEDDLETPDPEEAA